MMLFADGNHIVINRLVELMH